MIKLCLKYHCTKGKKKKVFWESPLKLLLNVLSWWIQFSAFETRLSRVLPYYRTLIFISLNLSECSIFSTRKFHVTQIASLSTRFVSTCNLHSWCTGFRVTSRRMRLSRLVSTRRRREWKQLLQGWLPTQLMFSRWIHNDVV